MENKHKLENLPKKLKIKITEVLNEKDLENLARETLFIQRSTSKLKGIDFVQLMSTEMLADSTISLEGLCDILSEINPEANISPQALEQRINNKNQSSVEFLTQVFTVLLKNKLQLINDDDSDKLLTPFNNVFLEDSTSMQLHEKLSKCFKGSGGSASISGVKIDLIYEIKQGHIQNIIIGGASVADQAHTDEILSHIKEGDLSIRDLGYFKISCCREIVNKKAFYLSRLRKGMCIYLNKDDKQPIDLIEYLNKMFANKPVIDIDIYIGKQERFPTRLIAYRLPQEVVNKKRMQARQAAKKRAVI